MPEICRFFGIIIRMFVDPQTQHHRPPFHAYYQNDIAVIAIDKIKLIGGSLPNRQQRLVEAWAKIHQSELLEDWQYLQVGRLPLKIEPLR
jgi:hypothetical protein